MAKTRYPYHLRVVRLAKGSKVYGDQELEAAERLLRRQAAGCRQAAAHSRSRGGQTERAASMEVAWRVLEAAADLIAQEVMKRFEPVKGG